MTASVSAAAWGQAALLLARKFDRLLRIGRADCPRYIPNRQIRIFALCGISIDKERRSGYNLPRKDGCTLYLIRKRVQFALQMIPAPDRGRRWHFEKAYRLPQGGNRPLEPSALRRSAPPP